MGLFRKNTDDEEASQEQYMAAPDPMPQQVLPAPSLDGVLPPGTNPQPAPANHNLSSQVSAPSAPVVDDVLGTVDASMQQSSSAMNGPSANDAGDYIMADPPASSSVTFVQSAPEPPVPIQTPTEPAYEKIPAPQAAKSAVGEPPVSEPVHIETPEVPATPELTDTPVEPNYEPIAVEPETAPEPEQPTEPSAPEPSSAAITVRTSDNTPEDLADIKLRALQQLSSLAGHLDQSPEEKFHTTMMMLQATDDQTLIKTAYDAAQAITDEKTRAQALLDVVNEINYFSQKNS